MPEYMFKECYDIDELDKLGIGVRLAGVFDVEFIYTDTELNQEIRLAAVDGITYGTVKFATAFTFNKNFWALLQDRFIIAPVFKRAKTWTWPAEGRAVLVPQQPLVYGKFDLTLGEFRNVLYNRLVASLELYQKKKEILKWKYGLYRRYVFANTPSKKFLRYGEVKPEITALPNGNEVIIKKFNDKYYLVKVFNPVIIGAGPKGDIYDTEATYFIVEHDFRENRNRILVEFSQEKFDMLKEM